MSIVTEEKGTPRLADLPLMLHLWILARMLPHSFLRACVKRSRTQMLTLQRDSWIQEVYVSE